MTHFFEPFEVAHLGFNHPLLAPTPPAHENPEHQEPYGQSQAEDPAPRPTENGARLIEQGLTPIFV
jgi:hypothetical protein